MGVGATKEFPYEIKESNITYEGKSLWKLNNGVKKVNNCFSRVKLAVRQKPSVYTYF